MAFLERGSMWVLSIYGLQFSRVCFIDAIGTEFLSFCSSLFLVPCLVDEG